MKRLLTYYVPVMFFVFVGNFYSLKTQEVMTSALGIWIVISLMVIGCQIEKTILEEED